MGKIIMDGMTTKPVETPADAFISDDYAKAEPDKLWSKVWQMACRVEEIPNVGDYVTYDIANDTIVVIRSAPDEISAFYNVCAHRGRRLVDGCGHLKRFHCKYHAWQYDLKGRNTRVLDKEDWGGALKQERLDLPHVKVDTWGGWVFINQDPECMPLLDYLAPIPEMLAPFEFEKMRYHWRMWTYFDCNWKTALEAFMEPYHVEGTHPQLMKFADFYAWSAAQGLHGNDGYEERDPGDEPASASLTRAGKGDARLSTYELHEEIWRTVRSSTTQTLVNAASRLKDELPEGTPGPEVMAHFIASAKAEDAARGVIWPEIDHEMEQRAGLAWNIFPNLGLLLGASFGQGYRVRPHGTDPDKCIFEAYAMERYPEGQEPKTEWVYADAFEDADKWPPVLLQDFENMVEVQRGMKSRGFRGALTNPKQERKVSNFQRNLARYMGVGGPKPLE